jgi:hercynylcysteine S-oxide lyase
VSEHDDGLPHPDLGATWRGGRPRPAGRHLDSAACSRQSHRVLEAVAHHARHEAELGGYVAEASAEHLLQQGRSVLGGLVGWQRPMWCSSSPPRRR